MTVQSENAAFWSKISRKYAAGPIRNMEGYLNTLERTKSYLKPIDNVLEMGCGTGSTALLLAPLVAQVTATDLAPGMIEIANEKLEAEELDNVTFAVAGIMDHSIADGPYDVVMAHNLLHLVPAIDNALAHIASLTKSGGYFISKTVCAPERGGLRYTMLRRLALPLMQVFGKAPYVAFITAAELEQKFRLAGFEIIETKDQAGLLPSRYVVARKS